MDENNMNSQEGSTADAYEKVNDAATKPASAFEMPSDNKTSAANTYYSAPEPTPESEQAGWSEPETESKPDTAVSYTSEPVYSSTTDTIYSSNQTAQESFSTGFAIASLVLGILSILSSCCCIGGLLGIPGIIFGCLQQKDEYDKKPGMAVAGIITSIVGIIFSLIALIYTVAISYLASEVPY